MVTMTKEQLIKFIENFKSDIAEMEQSIERGKSYTVPHNYAGRRETPSAITSKGPDIHTITIQITEY